MKPPPFDYVAPETVDQAVGLLADADREITVLAGGQSLLPALNMRMARPDVLVDISRVPELGTLQVDDAGSVVLGAAVTHAAVEKDARVRHGWPLLVAAIDRIGHPQIRNRGTVCGSFAHHDPAAELPAVAVALDARMLVRGPSGDREIPAADFFTGTFDTALDPGELLVAARFPATRGTGWAFAELARRHGDFAVAGVAVQLVREEGMVRRAEIVCCGMGSAPVRLRSAEDALTGRPVDPAAVESAVGGAVVGLDPPTDLHAGTDYRRDAIATLLARALHDAWERSDER